MCPQMCNSIKKNVCIEQLKMKLTKANLKSRGTERHIERSQN